MATGSPDLRDWTVRDLLILARAAGQLWESTGRSDPYDVLNDRQRGLMDLAAMSYLPASQGDTPDDEEDDEDDDSPHAADGYVTLGSAPGGRTDYEVRLEGIYHGRFPTGDIAVYELARAMAATGSFPAAWMEGEHGPSSRLIDDEIRRYHDAGGTNLLPLPGVRFSPGEVVLADGDGTPWDVVTDYGDLGVMLHASGDPSVTLVARNDQLTLVPDEPVPGEEGEASSDSEDASGAASLLPTDELMNPARPQGAVYYDRHQVTYVVTLEENSDVRRVLTSYGRLPGWGVGTVHDIRHDQTWHPLGSWLVTGIRFSSGAIKGDVPDRSLRHWVFK